MMKKIFFISFVLSFAFMIFSCNNAESQKSEKEDIVKTQKENISANTIQIYYFHGSIRCETCISVDEDTHQYLKDFFPEKMKKGGIIFQSINIDKNERSDLVKKYKIYGQTLLFIKGDNVLDLTDKAFIYVTTNPDKWMQIVQQTINDLKN